MDECDPRDIAIKSFFLGPQSENGDWLRRKWIEILDNWMAWRNSRFPGDGRSIALADQESEAFAESVTRMDRALAEILKDLEGETPKFSPRYIGHMVSEVSLPALMGHVCALLHNPNNTSREVSRVTSRFEEEAIADLAAMIGFPPSARGHFTSGGTLANFEALWRALGKFDRAQNERYGVSLLSLGPWRFADRYLEITGRKFKGPVVLVPGNKHFSWEKAVSLMGLGDEGFWPVALDEQGRLSLEDLRAQMEKSIAEDRPVLMVVSVAGTTEMGEVDPVDQVQALLEEYRERGIDVWHHVDAAFGGYYRTMIADESLSGRLSSSVRAALTALSKVDSITLDPHKLGYVPYACGAFIARDGDHYRTRGFSAAYLKDDNQSRWSFTLEGSRSGAGVTAVWLANKTLGLNARGYGRLLEKGIEARERMHREFARQVPDYLPVLPSDLNIICFSIAPAGSKLSALNERTAKLFNHFEASPNFSVSKTILTKKSYKSLIERLARERDIELDCDEWMQLRLVLMNPFITSKESDVDLIGEFVSELRGANSLMT
ncbi:MAG TPA: pyridoxal-dependent decarboxylase [Bdellovibrionales bacterium]|nr:pyridoxal-dependent decarboxylase [Bdellovibrionales bacterium]